MISPLEAAVSFGIFLIALLAIAYVGLNELLGYDEDDDE